MSDARCALHLLRPAAGYCSVCGEFGCDECLVLHEGNYYCRRDYAPIQKLQDAEKKHAEQRKRPERQRLVVHPKEGHLLYGVCYALDIHSDGFTLELMDKKGRTLNKTAEVKFENLKAVFYVKSFDGNYDPSQQYHEFKPEGSALVVEFLDGEVIEGHALKSYRAADPRFYLAPDDNESNNVSILVERTALRSVHTPEGFSHRWREEIDTFIRQNRELGFSKAELMGDFFFHRKDYGRAMRQYRYAFEAEPKNLRLRKKMIAAEYNIGIRYVRHHEYERALYCMREVIKADPKNARAQKMLERLEEAHRRHEQGEHVHDIPLDD